MAKEHIAKKLAWEIKSLIAVSRDPIVITKKAGDVIIKHNDRGAFMYLVLSGELEISFNGDVIEAVQPGGIVGEMSLIDSTIRSATVIARKKSELIPIGKGRFAFLIARKPEFAFLVMRVMSKRLRRMNMQILAEEKKPAPRKTKKASAPGKVKSKAKAKAKTKIKGKAKAKKKS